MPAGLVIILYCIVVFIVVVVVVDVFFSSRNFENRQTREFSKEEIKTRFFTAHAIVCFTCLSSPTTVFRKRFLKRGKKTPFTNLFFCRRLQQISNRHAFDNIGTGVICVSNNNGKKKTNLTNAYLRNKNRKTVFRQNETERHKIIDEWTRATRSSKNKTVGTSAGNH